MTHVYIALYPAKDKNKRATVGPLPGVTQDIAGYKVMLFSQCFFNITDSFICIYSFARQQKTENIKSFCYCMKHLIHGI